MKTLVPLVELSKKQGLQHFRLPGQTGCEKTDLLYQGLVEGKIKDEASALKALYGKQPDKEDFERCLQELEGQLVNTLCLIERNSPTLGDQGLAYEEAIRYLAVANVLAMNGVRRGLFELYTKVLRLAETFELTTLAAQTIKHIRKISVYFHGDDELYTKHRDECSVWVERASAEARIEAEFYRMMFALSDSDGEAIYQFFKDFDAGCLPPNLEGPFPTFYAASHAFYIWYFQAIVEGQHEQAIRTCEYAAQHCLRAPFDMGSNIIAFQHLQMGCYLQLKDFENGMALARSIREGDKAQDSPNFFKNEAIAFLLAMHCQAYAAALDICRFVWNNPAIEFLDGEEKQVWINYKAYLLCMMLSGMVAQPEGDDNFDPARRGAFPMELPDEEALSESSQVALLIAQIWYGLLTSRFEWAAERIRLTSGFIGRYNKQESQYRSNCFLQMMQEIPKGAFHQAAVERYAQPINKRLSEAPVGLIQQLNDPELIPLEALWQHLLNSLPQKRIKVKDVTQVRKKSPKRVNVPCSGRLQIVDELSQLISSKMLMRMSIPGQDPNKKMDRLLQMVRERPDITDEEAMAALYPNGNADTAFQKLKSKLRERLRDTLLFSKQHLPINGDINIATQHVSGLLAVAVMMVRREAWVAGQKYAEKALQLAMEYQQIDLTMESARLCRKIAAESGTLEMFNHYEGIYRFYLELLGVEDQLEWRHSELALLRTRQLSNYQGVGHLAKRFYGEIQHLIAKYPYATVQRFGRDIQITAAMYDGGFEAVLQASDEALTYFRSLPFKMPNTMQVLLINQIEACTRTRQLEKGQMAVQEALEIAKKVEVKKNFVALNLHAIIHLIYCRRYQEAYQHAYEYYGASTFEHVGDFLVEYTNIVKAYLQLLIEAGRITPNTNDEVIGRFRHGRFSNQIEIYNKDKQGLNIAIRIVQFLAWIAQGKADDAFDQIDAMEKYMYRHVSREAAYRPHYFIKMMLQLPISGFNADMARGLAQPYLEKMELMPVHKANYSLELEIVPFEDLWEAVLEVVAMQNVSLR